MVKLVSEYFTLKRRYTKSVSLDRDFDKVEAVEGYILTDRPLHALRRILIDPIDTSATCAKTLTSVYGTGKSAFAQFLTCLCAPQGSLARDAALEISNHSLAESDRAILRENLPIQGFFRAIATAQRESLSHTIIRALNFGIEFGLDRGWNKKRNSDLAKKISDLASDVKTGKEIPNSVVLTIVKELLQAVKAPVLLLIDELGKNLEFASQHGAEDLYLLQQLAELKPVKGQAFYLIGTLHQAFVDYGDRLAAVQRNEWAKIQGRFEDIAFSGQPRQMTRLIGQAIECSLPTRETKLVNAWASDWCKYLTKYGITDISADLLAANYPLHPIAALVLPILCANYAQNDRSLFTFLGSAEPFSFKNYLDETEFKPNFPLLKLDRIYDYFIEAIGAGFGSRPQLQKWVEIHSLISSMRSLSPAEEAFLKTIGILNLIDSVGELRASTNLVKLALADRPLDKDQHQHVDDLIQHFSEIKGVVNRRRDELRLWEGTDFNIEAELKATTELEHTPLSQVLSSSFPLKPIIAQRHSYQTGTVRYFECRYFDSSVNWANIQCAGGYDGMVIYWLDSQELKELPKLTRDKKPLVVIAANSLNSLEASATEYKSLQKLQARPELANDRVARQEIRYRVYRAEQLLNDSLNESFNPLHSDCWVMGQKTAISRLQDFNAQLSYACDQAYAKSPKLLNELVNRRELTAQAVKAMRLLIEAMLGKSDQERLGLQGYGPETSIYESILKQTGIHRLEDGILDFYPPQGETVSHVWQLMETFCTSAIAKPKTLNLLYDELESPPYGVKRGIIPILLAALLLYHNDDVSVYKDGIFIPVLGAEHFELLVKYPQRFAVKYFEIVGVRSQVFRELEAILKSSNTKKVTAKVRNVTMLSVVKPLFQFAKNLKIYTTKTKRISSEAQAVVQALQKAQEPDELIFTSLPIACGLEPIVSGVSEDGAAIAKQFKGKLVQVLHEIQNSYDQLLAHCHSLLHEAFGVRGGGQRLREDLGVRASYLTDGCIERTLKRFVLAAADKTAEDKTWLESLLMIVADKPAESWNDADEIGFESKLSDLARRFINLEALQKGMAASKNKGFDARRITIGRPDGYEVHRLLWLDPDDSDLLNVEIDEILKKPIFKDSERLKQGLIALLAEKVLNNQTAGDVAPISAKVTNLKHSQIVS